VYQQEFKLFLKKSAGKSMTCRARGTVRTAGRRTLHSETAQNLNRARPVRSASRDMSSRRGPSLFVVTTPNCTSDKVDYVKIRKAAGPAPES